MATCSGYIFVGGSYRTGTDLIRNILNASEEVAICGETHYFGNPRTATLLWKGLLNYSEEPMNGRQASFQWDLPNAGSRQKLAEIGDISTNEGAKRVVDYLYDHVHMTERAFWRWLPDHVSREEFLARFLATDRTERAFFNLMMACYANGKSIWGEKTPAHIHYVPTLLEWFPEGKFIHMFRDPRAIFASETRKKSTSENVSRYHRLFRRTDLSYEIYMSSSVMSHWVRVVQLHYQYQQRYPENYYLLKFEDLLTDPELQLQSLCSFLGIELTKEMLAMEVVNSSFTDPGKITGFDKSVAYRWRQQVQPNLNRWFIFWCKKQLLEFGYRP